VVQIDAPIESDAGGFDFQLERRQSARCRDRNGRRL